MSVLVVACMEPGSAVAAQTVGLIDELARDQRIEVWTPRGLPVRPMSCPHRTVDPADPGLERDADQFSSRIFVMGGSRAHRHVGQLAREIPGIVILHDVSMLEPFKATVRARGGNTQGLIDAVRRMHGPLVGTQLELEYVFPATGSESPALHQAAHALPHYLQSATVVVTHSDWAASRVSASTTAPVRVARLPAAPYENADGGAGVPVLGGTPAPVVVPGIVNRHKMIPTAIRAFADSGLAGAGHELVILGPCDTRMEAGLRLIARRARVEQSLRFMNPQEHRDFLAYLASALAVVTLREGNTEAQSAALLSGLLSGSPVIATDDGAVRDLPDDIVLKVSASDAQAHVARSLVGIADGTVDVDALVRRARSWVRGNHSSAGYLDVIRDAMTTDRERRPEIMTVLTIASRIRRAGIAEVPLAVRAVAEALDSLDGS